MTDLSPLSDAFDVDALACPGVFYPTLSGDGVLSRIRTPGGLLTATQAALVADIADRFAGGMVTITNRANLQLRALTDRLPADILRDLQRAELASRQPSVDHLRNIMASPTAGLDPGTILDTRPLVQALDRYITDHARLAALPAKFSVGFDGGERVSIAGLPNDVLFRAYRGPGGGVRLRVVVRIGAGDGGWVDLGFALAEDQVVQATAALAETYLELLPPDGSKPRLRYLLAVLDQHALQERLLQQAPALTVGGDTLPPIASAPTSAPVGVHAQTGDDDLTYVGLVPFVAGRLSSAHLRLLAALAERSASGSLRLSPWRNVLVPGVPRASVEAVQADLEAAGLSCRAPSLASGIVACAGSAGCASGFVDTVRDALALSARLNGVAPAAEPLNIHLSGCAKYCAQRRQADVTLLGRAGDGGRYDLFVRSEGDARPGRLVAEALAPADALAAVERLVKVSS